MMEYTFILRTIPAYSFFTKETIFKKISRDFMVNMIIRLLKQVVKDVCKTDLQYLLQCLGILEVNYPDGLPRLMLSARLEIIHP